MEFISLKKMTVFMQTAQVCVLITFYKRYVVKVKKKIKIYQIKLHIMMQYKKGLYFYMIIKCTLEASKFDC